MEVHLDLGIAWLSQALRRSVKAPSRRSSSSLTTGGAFGPKGRLRFVNPWVTRVRTLSRSSSHERQQLTPTFMYMHSQQTFVESQIFRMNSLFVEKRELKLRCSLHAAMDSAASDATQGHQQNPKPSNTTQWQGVGGSIGSAVVCPNPDSIIKILRLIFDEILGCRCLHGRFQELLAFMSCKGGSRMMFFSRRWVARPSM